MLLTKQQILILRGKVCPYCLQPSKIVAGDAVYGKGMYSHKLFWSCLPCGAWVGCHGATRTALGRLANAELRREKTRAHFYFDQIWQGGYIHRTDAYKWLSNMLDTPKEYTHIGCFSVNTCKEVVRLSRELLSNLKRLDKDFGLADALKIHNKN